MSRPRDLVEAYKVLINLWKAKAKLRKAKRRCYFRGRHRYDSPICDYDSSTKQFTYRLICKDCGHEEKFCIPEAK